MLRSILAALAVVCFVSAASIVGMGATTEPPTYANPSDVRIDINNGQVQGHGSGVFLGDGVVLTAGHVGALSFVNLSNKMKSIQVTTADGKTQWGETVWVSERYDIALVRIYDYASIKPAKLAAHNAQLGDAVEVIGDPDDIKGYHAWGKVGRAGEDTYYMWPRIQYIDAMTWHGDSGGAVYNAQHEVIGITVGGVVSFLGMQPFFIGVGVIVPVAVIHDLIPQI